MDKFSLSPSRLPLSRQRALTRQLAAQCRKQACPTYTLLFRDSTLFGANAMALPGGSIVVTDALVGLALNDTEVIAVIAHELGHVAHRHSLRLALQSIGAGVILVAVTGDIGSVTDLAAGLPSLLLQQGYSRDMEREADAYALAWLDTACIHPGTLPTFWAASTRTQPTPPPCSTAIPAPINGLNLSWFRIAAPRAAALAC